MTEGTQDWSKIKDSLIEADSQTRKYFLKFRFEGALSFNKEKEENELGNQCIAKLKSDLVLSPTTLRDLIAMGTLSTSELNIIETSQQDRDKFKIGKVDTERKTRRSTRRSNIRKPLSQQSDNTDILTSAVYTDDTKNYVIIKNIYNPSGLDVINFAFFQAGILFFSDTIDSEQYTQNMHVRQVSKSQLSKVPEKLLEYLVRDIQIDTDVKAYEKDLHGMFSYFFNCVLLLQSRTRAFLESWKKCADDICINDQGRKPEGREKIPNILLKEMIDFTLGMKRDSEIIYLFYALGFATRADFHFIIFEAIPNYIQSPHFVYQDPAPEDLTTILREMLEKVNSESNSKKEQFTIVTTLCEELLKTQLSLADQNKRVFTNDELYSSKIFTEWRISLKTGKLSVCEIESQMFSWLSQLVDRFDLGELYRYRLVKIMQTMNEEYGRIFIIAHVQVLKKITLEELILIPWVIFKAHILASFSCDDDDEILKLFNIKPECSQDLKELFLDSTRKYRYFEVMRSEDDLKKALDTNYYAEAHYGKPLYMYSFQHCFEDMINYYPFCPSVYKRFVIISTIMSMKNESLILDEFDPELCNDTYGFRYFVGSQRCFVIPKRPDYQSFLGSFRISTKDPNFIILIYLVQKIIELLTKDLIKIISCEKLEFSVQGDCKFQDDIFLGKLMNEKMTESKEGRGEEEDEDGDEEEDEEEDEEGGQDGGQDGDEEDEQDGDEDSDEEDEDEEGGQDGDEDSDEEGGQHGDKEEDEEDEDEEGGQDGNEESDEEDEEGKLVTFFKQMCSEYLVDLKCSSLGDEESTLDILLTLMGSGKDILPEETVKLLIESAENSRSSYLANNFCTADTYEAWIHAVDLTFSRCSDHVPGKIELPSVKSHVQEGKCSICLLETWNGTSELIELENLCRLRTKHKAHTSCLSVWSLRCDFCPACHTLPFLKAESYKSTNKSK